MHHAIKRQSEPLQLATLSVAYTYLRTTAARLLRPLPYCIYYYHLSLILPFFPSLSPNINFLDFIIGFPYHNSFITFLSHLSLVSFPYVLYNKETKYRQAIPIFSCVCLWSSLRVGYYFRPGDDKWPARQLCGFFINAQALIARHQLKRKIPAVLLVEYGLWFSLGPLHLVLPSRR